MEIRRKGSWAWRVLLLSMALPAVAQPEDIARAELDQTLSPYFLVERGADLPGAFPLEATNVHVHVSGVMADVTVKQTYRNAGQKPIEALYVFPASTRAAVHALRMTIGERVVEAVVKERDAARRTYEDAKSKGQSAALLEQQRPNVFQMNVANVLPGERIEVELRYAELLVPESGVYELVYPTVVGPRYSNRPASAAPPEHAWVRNPYLRKDTPSLAHFQLDVDLDGGLPLTDVASSTHTVKIDFASPTRAHVELAPGGADPGNRDFILSYRMQDARIQAGLLLDQGKDERFFMLTVEPPKRVTSTDVPAREYIFVVDVSGSMNGFPLDVSKKLMHGLLQTLRLEDRFNVVLFAGASSVLSPASVAATPTNMAAALHEIDAQRGGGGTELLQALDTALALPRADALRSIVIVTDGYVDVEAEAFARIREHASDASVFAFGIGTSVNRHLIEGLAHAGHGEPFVVTRLDAADAVVARFQRYVAAALLSDVELDFGELGAYDVEPDHVPIMLADRPIVVSGKWRGQARGEIVVRGRRGDQSWSARIAVPQGPNVNPALRYLWARERLRLLSDFAGSNEQNRDQVVDLGLRYNLLTRYTSFVAVDQVVRHTTGTPESVSQPLPLPQSVSELAVGAHAPGTPEPGTLLLLGLAGGAAARALRKRARS